LNYLSDFVHEIDNCVVISIDYKVAPQNKYPELFYESMHSYEKIVKNCEKLFNFKIKKLVLIGDSGGGHLCLSIMKYAISKSLRKPDGLVLIYPCSRILFDVMTPSLLMACEDNFIQFPIVGHLQKSVMDLDKYNIDHYEKNDDLNFYLTDIQIIKDFPKTSIIIASNDPLRDDCYRLADFLIQNSVDVQIKEFLFHPHGFINLSSMIPYFRKTEKICIEIIKNYFNC